jgi:hypothetical protein
MAYWLHVVPLGDTGSCSNASRYADDCTSHWQYPRCQMLAHVLDRQILQRTGHDSVSE